MSKLSVDIYIQKSKFWQPCLNSWRLVIFRWSVLFKVSRLDLLPTCLVPWSSKATEKNGLIGKESHLCEHICIILSAENTFSYTLNSKRELPRMPGLEHPAIKAVASLECHQHCTLPKNSVAPLFQTGNAT